MTETLEVHGLIAMDGDTACLAGSQCTNCATFAFPAQNGCAACGSPMTTVCLPSSGSLWSWTTQNIRPKPPYDGPEEHETFAVGYIDLGPLKVESRIEGKDFDAWAIGEPMVLSPGTPDLGGNIWRYRFVPQGAQQ